MKYLINKIEAFDEIYLQLNSN